MTIASLVGADIYRIGSKGSVVEAIQTALIGHGYRIIVDGDFESATDNAVRRFQTQHGLTSDGEVGTSTAAALDVLFEQSIASATPTIVPAEPATPASGWPHDDTASLQAFYGRPWDDQSLFARVTPPFAMTYKEDNGVLTPIHSIQIHRKCADALNATLLAIWDHYGHDQSAIDATSIAHFSGSYNYRPIAGSERLSEHSFAAAVDFNAEQNGFYYAGQEPHFTMEQPIIDAFKANGAFWGGDYKQRKDPMHYGWAHE